MANCHARNINKKKSFYILNKYALWLNIPAAVRPADVNLNKNSLNQSVKTVVFYGDHGVAKENSYISSTKNNINENNIFPDISLEYIHQEYINLGSFLNQPLLEQSVNLNIGPGTSNFCRQSAMSHEQLYRAMNSGRQVAQRIKLGGTQQYIGKAAGQGSTLSTRAISCALLEKKPFQMFINANKTFNDENKLIQQALSYHKKHFKSVLEILRRLGGFEITALVGSYLSCAHMGITIIIHDFISSIAALITLHLCPEAEQWLIYSVNSEKY